MKEEEEMSNRFLLLIFCLSNLAFAIPPLCLEDGQKNHECQEGSALGNINDQLKGVEKKLEKKLLGKGCTDSYQQYCKDLLKEKLKDDKLKDVNEELKKTTKRFFLNENQGESDWSKSVKSKISDLAESVEILHHDDKNKKESIATVKSNFANHCSFEEIKKNKSCSEEDISLLEEVYLDGESFKSFDKELSNIYYNKIAPVSEKKHKRQTAIYPKIFKMFMDMTKEMTTGDKSKINNSELLGIFKKGKKYCNAEECIRKRKNAVSDGIKNTKFSIEINDPIWRRFLFGTGKDKKKIKEENADIVRDMIIEFHASEISKKVEEAKSVDEKAAVKIEAITNLLAKFKDNVENAMFKNSCDDIKDKIVKKCDHLKDVEKSLATDKGDDILKEIFNVKKLDELKKYSSNTDSVEFDYLFCAANNNFETNSKQNSKKSDEAEKLRKSLIQKGILSLGGKSANEDYKGLSYADLKKDFEDIKKEEEEHLARGEVEDNVLGLDTFIADQTSEKPILKPVLDKALVGNLKDDPENGRTLFDNAQNIAEAFIGAGVTEADLPPPVIREDGSSDFNPIRNIVTAASQGATPEVFQQSFGTALHTAIENSDGNLSLQHNNDGDNDGEVFEGNPDQVLASLVENNFSNPSGSTNTSEAAISSSEIATQSNGTSNPAEISPNSLTRSGSSTLSDSANVNTHLTSSNRVSRDEPLSNETPSNYVEKNDPVDTNSPFKTNGLEGLIGTNSSQAKDSEASVELAGEPSNAEAVTTSAEKKPEISTEAEEAQPSLAAIVPSLAPRAARRASNLSVQVSRPSKRKRVRSVSFPSYKRSQGREVFANVNTVENHIPISEGEESTYVIPSRLLSVDGYEPLSREVFDELLSSIEVPEKNDKNYSDEARVQQLDKLFSYEILEGLIFNPDELGKFQEKARILLGIEEDKAASVSHTIIDKDGREVKIFPVRINGSVVLSKYYPKEKKVKKKSSKKKPSRSIASVKEVSESIIGPSVQYSDLLTALNTGL